MKTFVFIDASNLFYGGEKSLGWRIDYQKLFQYLHDKYDSVRILYFGGVEIHDYPFDYLTQETVPLPSLEEHVSSLVVKYRSTLNEAQLVLFERHLRRIRFYRRLESFGYELYLKPVKRYEQEDGTVRRKANCDVEMTLRLMREEENFGRVVVLSGDGDFLPVLKYIRERGKEVIILARGARTAREIRQFAGSRFCDFTRLEKHLRFEEK